MALADLDAAVPEKRGQARQAYTRLASENPESWEPRIGLAYLELSAQNRAAASQQFALAEKLGCRDPRAFLHWGTYAPPEGEPRERARVLLKAAELNPGDPAIEYSAGLNLADAGDCEAALPHLLRLKRVTPDQAPDYLWAVVTCSHNLGQDSQAQVAANQLLSLARTPQDEQAAKALVRMANEPRVKPATPGTELTATAPSEAPSRPRPESAPEPRPGLFRQPVLIAPSTNRAEGLLVQVDCLGTGARLWLQTGDGKTAYMIQQGNKVTLLRGGQSTRDELQCGPQRPPQKVVIRYDEQQDAASSPENIVRVLEFL